MAEHEQQDFFLAVDDPVIERPPPPHEQPPQEPAPSPPARMQMIPVDVPVRRAHRAKVLRVTVLSGLWRPKRGQERLLGGSPLQATWRLHFTMNDVTFATAPRKGSHEMDFDESFTLTLRNSDDDFGLLLVELQTLLGVPLAGGGLEVVGGVVAPAYAAPGGATLHMSGAAAEGELLMRVVVENPVEALPRAANGAPRMRPNKLHRSSSTGDVVDSTRVLVRNSNVVTPLARAKEKGMIDAATLKTMQAGKLHWAQRGGHVQPLMAKCEYCRRTRRFDTMVALANCGHRSCRDCVHDAVSSALRAHEMADVACRVCGTAPTEADLQTFLTPAEMELFHDAQLEQFLAQDNRFVRCPNADCRCPMETSTLANSGRDWGNNGGADAMGPDGKPLRGAHLRHYNQYRYRCPKCSTAFCASCLTNPYHAGFTCDEFRAYSAARHCRYCNAALLASSVTDVCAAQECQGKIGGSCSVKLACGHQCGGISGEKVCPPCLHADCDKPDGRVHGSEFCSICWVEDLASAPTILLECGHAFHKHCVDQKINGGWPGMRITFGYLDCPLCKKRLAHPSLTALLAPHVERYEKIRAHALQRLKSDNMEKDAKLVEPSSAYYKNPEMYALHSFAFYNCFQCKRAFFGGRRDCENQDDRVRDPAEMICFDCGDLGKVECKDAKNHAEYHGWKCRYCCSVAVWFCWGNTHFCEPCHQKAYELRDMAVAKLPQCAGRLTCKLKCDHPPAGTEFSLGCGVCNNQSNQVMRKAIDADDKAKGEADEPAADGGSGMLNAVRQMFSKPAAPPKKAEVPQKRRASRGKK